MGCSSSKDQPKAAAQQPKKAAKKAADSETAGPSPGAAEAGSSTVSRGATTGPIAAGVSNNVEEGKEVESRQSEVEEEAAAEPAEADGGCGANGHNDTAAAEERKASVTLSKKDGGSGNQQDAKVNDGDEDYLGPGPSADFPIDSVFGCFDEGNGLLFRLVNEKRRVWAFYNDTEDYVMRVSVVFGNESMVRPLGETTQTVMNAVTGQCQLDVTVRPGQTQAFMRGDYNGFTTGYEAVPLYLVEEEEAEGSEDDDDDEDHEDDADSRDGSEPAEEE